MPVVRIQAEDEQEHGHFVETLKRGLAFYAEDGKQEPAAIAFSGAYHTGFRQIQELASWILEGAGGILNSVHPLILVIENDIAKVLGNALNVMLERKKEVICIDGIHAADGDYIDIGEPVAEGRVVPVVIKTLIFNS